METHELIALARRLVQKLGGQYIVSDPLSGAGFIVYEDGGAEQVLSVQEILQEFQDVPEVVAALASAAQGGGEAQGFRHPTNWPADQPWPPPKYEFGEPIEGSVDLADVKSAYATFGNPFEQPSAEKAAPPLQFNSIAEAQAAAQQNPGWKVSTSSGFPTLVPMTAADQAAQQQPQQPAPQQQGRVIPGEQIDPRLDGTFFIQNPSGALSPFTPEPQQQPTFNTLLDGKLVEYARTRDPALRDDILQLDSVRDEVERERGMSLANAFALASGAARNEDQFLQYMSVLTNPDGIPEQTNPLVRAMQDAQATQALTNAERKPEILQRIADIERSEFAFPATDGLSGPLRDETRLQERSQLLDALAEIEAGEQRLLAGSREASNAMLFPPSAESLRGESTPGQTFPMGPESEEFFGPGGLFMSPAPVEPTVEDLVSQGVRGPLAQAFMDARQTKTAAPAATGTPSLSSAFDTRNPDNRAPSLLPAQPFLPGADGMTQRQSAQARTAPLNPTFSLGDAGNRNANLPGRSLMDTLTEIFNRQQQQQKQRTFETTPLRRVRFS